MVRMQSSRGKQSLQSGGVASSVKLIVVPGPSHLSPSDQSNIPNRPATAQSMTRPNHAGSSGEATKMVNGFTSSDKHGTHSERRSRPASRSAKRPPNDGGPYQADQPAKRQKHRDRTAPTDPCFPQDAPPPSRSHSRAGSSAVCPSSHPSSRPGRGQVLHEPTSRPASRARGLPLQQLRSEPDVPSSPYVQPVGRELVPASDPVSYAQPIRPSIVRPPSRSRSPRASAQRTIQSSATTKRGLDMMPLPDNIVVSQPAAESMSSQLMLFQSAVPGLQERKELRETNKLHQVRIQAEVDEVVRHGGRGDSFERSAESTKAKEVGEWSKK